MFPLNLPLYAIPFSTRSRRGRRAQVQEANDRAHRQETNEEASKYLEFKDFFQCPVYSLLFIKSLLSIKSIMVPDNFRNFLISNIVAVRIFKIHLKSAISNSRNRHLFRTFQILPTSPKHIQRLQSVPTGNARARPPKPRPQSPLRGLVLPLWWTGFPRRLIRAGTASAPKSATATTKPDAGTRGRVCFVISFPFNFFHVSYSSNLRQNPFR
jgi:hypothetical protein